ncbi:MAG: SRPBCC family protein [Acidimicrobiia bacterium]|jgi:carbon monoxide dehydrogenase subunit G
MRLHETRLIDRPLEEVFAFTSDFSNSEKWDPGVESSQRVEGGDPGVGARYELIVAFGSRRIPMVYETTAIEKDSRVVLEGKGGSIAAVDDIRFEAKDGSTLVDYTADLTFTNWMRYVAPLLAPLLNKVGERALDGLVETLEQ